MIKNFIISALVSYIIARMNFWRYDGVFDKICIYVTILSIVLIIFASIDDFVQTRKMEDEAKKRRAQRFADQVREILEREDY